MEKHKAARNFALKVGVDPDVRKAWAMVYMGDQLGRLVECLNTFERSTSADEFMHQIVSDKDRETL